MVTGPALVDLARRYVLGPDEPVTWMREYPDGPAVDLETADRSYSIRLWPDLMIAGAPWVDAVVVLRRDDLELDVPGPREVLLIPVDGPPVRLTDADEVAGLGARVVDGSLDPVAFAEVLVECQWPVGGPKRLVADQAVSDQAGTGPPAVWTEDDGSVWLAFYAVRDDPSAFADMPRTVVHHWTVRFAADEPASWEHAPLPADASVVPPWHRR